MLANLTLQDVVGETQASSFMLDMNDLFERFVTERLQRALKGRLEVRSQHPDRLDEEGAVAIRPDLVFRSGGAARFVADVKYKLTDDAAAGRHPDYYQLLAYTTALDLPEACSSTASTPTVPTTLTATAMPAGGPALQSHQRQPARRLPRRFEFAMPARCCTPTRWTSPARPRMSPETWTGSPTGSSIGPRPRSLPAHLYPASQSRKFMALWRTCGLDRPSVSPAMATAAMLLAGESRSINGASTTHKSPEILAGAARGGRLGGEAVAS